MRLKRCYCSYRLYLSLITCVSIYLLLNIDHNDKVHVIKVKSLLKPTPPTSPKEKPVILFWTLKNSKNLSVSLKEGETFLARKKCPLSQCIFTTDQSLYASASAVVFHLLDYEPGVTAKPPTRTPDQWYVFYNREPPTNHNILRKTRNALISNGFFNLTMSIRRDSDIYAPYVSFRKETNPNPRSCDLGKKSGKLIAWFVSRCRSSSRRENYVHELRKYVSIDVYGRCGTLSCTVNKEKTCYKMLNRYKFYLAFENSICNDYVTEKVIFPMMYADVVPVVMGGVNYSDFLPPHSFIDVRDYDSPSHLARYLKELDEDDEKFLSYFKWRESYIPVYSPEPFCELCKLLGNKTFPGKVYENFDKWWNHNQCSKGLVWMA